MTTETEETLFWLPLKTRAEVATGTLQFSFDRPAKMVFKAGQFMDLTLVDPPETDAEGNTRGFSINTAPDESELVFTTRLRDTAFKRVLRSMPLGTKVKLEGPFGNFTLHNNVARPAVMIAGGIGVTPFRSIVHRAAHEHLSHRILLLFANRFPEIAPFLDEFRSLESANKNFIFVPVMTNMSDSHSAWSGVAGNLDFALIQRQVAAIPKGAGVGSPIYYVAGPPGMVTALHGVLNAGGVDDDDIRVEEFGGY